MQIIVLTFAKLQGRVSIRVRAHFSVRIKIV